MNKNFFFCFLIIFSVFLFASQCSRPADSSSVVSCAASVPAAVQDTFTAAFYNVENLFDLTNDGTEYKEYSTASNWNEETFNKKIAGTASVISALKPDFIGLAEVESFRALRKLQNELKKQGNCFSYSAFGDLPVKTNTCPALLSKYPLKNIRCHEVRLEKGNLSRSILEADVMLPCNKLKVFVNHWPSKSHKESERILAAKVLKKYISALPQGTDCILIGDFNSNYNDCDSIDKWGRRILGTTGLASVLGTVSRQSGNGFRYFTIQDMADGPGGIFDTWLELLPKDRMSMVYNGYKQTTDHILLLPALFDSTGISYINGSFRVFTMNGKLLRNNIPYRWQFEKRGNEKIHKGEGYSDHLPVFAKFRCGRYLKTGRHSSVNIITNAASVPDSQNAIPQVADRWTACSEGVSINDTKNSDGCCSISAGSHKSNRSIARRTLKPLSDGKVCFRIRGNGKLSFRFRSPGMDWIYYNAPDFEEKSTARYRETSYGVFTSIECRLPREYCTNRLETEIRAGKGVPFNFDIEEQAAASGVKRRSN